MLAFLYLAAMTYFGDRVCRCFYPLLSVQHRIATSFLVGLLLSTWITYLVALAFYWSSQPLMMGNIGFLVVLVLAAFKLRKRSLLDHPEPIRRRAVGSDLWDWVFIVAYAVLACWLMFATLNFNDGAFQINFKAWTDFGANLSLAQSFVLGHNFPTEHPYFPGESIRYHFLFWFQAGNLEFLGLNLVWGLNLLSIASMLALLILIMTFTETLFNSRVVSRIAASLFFFSTSFSYIPFLRSQQSFQGAVNAILNSTEFLPSGYPFRGDDWGVLTANLFANQRHLISAIGFLLVVLIFLVGRYHSKPEVNPGPSSTTEGEILTKIDGGARNRGGPARESFRRPIAPFIFSGVLIGALPYWNSAVFVSALVVLMSILFLFPYRLFSAILIATAILVGLPQVLLLRSGTAGTQTLLHWGYTLEHPTVALVLEYLGWTFGLKWVLIIIALVLLSGFHRRLFLAFSSLLAVVFLFRLSTDVFNNHKLLNVWSIFASIYAAYALWQIGKIKVIGTALAAVLTVVMIFGGIIDLFPVHNDPALAVPFENDRLTTWLLNNTQPSDVFLTQTLLTHPILFTGRKIFLGNTLFAWSAGYDVARRETVYRRMFEERDVAELVRLLNNYKIMYVGIDDGVRENKAIRQLNDAVYEQHFPKVFEDTDRQYANLTIYRLPLESSVPLSAVDH